MKWNRDSMRDYKLYQRRESRVPHTVKPVVTVNGVTVSFDGFKALDDLDLHILQGELRCLIGPNGAGKTTLLDILTGRLRPDRGQVVFEGNTNLLELPEHEIARIGIGRKFQKPTIFPHHTVWENLELSVQGDRSVWSTLFRRLAPEKVGKIEETLEIIGLKDKRHMHAGMISHGQKQWLELGMLLVQDPRLLLIDEPVAGMSEEEAEKTAELVVSLAGQHSIIIVEHDMHFVRSIAREVTVLHQGRVLFEGSMQEVQENPTVQEVYLGEDHA